MITKKDIHKDFTEKIKVIDGGICAVSKVKVAGVRDGKYGVSIIVCKNSDVAGVLLLTKLLQPLLNILRIQLKMESCLQL